MQRTTLNPSRLTFGILFAVAVGMPLGAQAEPYAGPRDLPTTSLSVGFDPAAIKYAISYDRRVVFERAMAPVLTDDQKDAFWNVYADYEKDTGATLDREIKLLGDYAAEFRTLTSKQAADLVNEASDIQTRNTEVRRKYALKMAKKTNSVVAGRFFEVGDFIESAAKAGTLSRLPLLGDPPL